MTAVKGRWKSATSYMSVRFSDSQRARAGELMTHSI